MPLIKAFCYISNAFVAEMSLQKQHLTHDQYRISISFSISENQQSENSYLIENKLIFKDKMKYILDYCQMFIAVKMFDKCLQAMSTIDALRHSIYFLITVVYHTQNFCVV